MYSTCLFCNADLGRNEALYDFPVGRRLAFDSRKGRLWVVCRSCERWNLTPLEERWEAIEQAERKFSATRQRVSTEHIGLSRLADGTELVRIGSPLRPEFAAWRYGDQFGRRRRRRMILAGGGVGAFGAVVAGGAVAGLSVAMFGGLIAEGVGSIVNGRPNEVVARLWINDSKTVSIRRRHLAETRLLGSDGQLQLDLRYKGGEQLLQGAEAMRVAAHLIPHVNRFGGKREVVKSAVVALDESGGAEGYLQRLSKYAAEATRVATKGSSGKRKAEKSGWTMEFRSGLFGLSPADRLALEMALHEEAELRALQGELQALERAWRDAEEIAAIADGVLTPTPVQNALERLRRIAGV